MRIVSQDGKLDLNFTNVSLFVETGYEFAYCIIGNVGGTEEYELAVYDSEERTLEVMEGIRKSYRENQAFLQRVDMIEGKKVTRLDYTTYFYMPKE